MSVEVRRVYEIKIEEKTLKLNEEEAKALLSQLTHLFPKEISATEEAAPRKWIRTSTGWRRGIRTIRTQRVNEVVEAFKSSEKPLTVKELAEKLRCSASTVGAALSVLVQQERVKKYGRTSNNEVLYCLKTFKVKPEHKNDKSVYVAENIPPFGALKRERTEALKAMRDGY